MSPSESAPREGPGADGSGGGSDNPPSRHPASSDVEEQGSELGSCPREAQEPAKSAAPSVPQQAESENNQQRNERPQQEEAAANLESDERESSAVQQDNGGEQQEDPLLDITMPPAPDPARLLREYVDDGWEEVDSSSEEDSGADSDSEGDSDTSSESESSDEGEKKEAAGGADGEEELPFGCSHYRRRCKVVAPCWWVILSISIVPGALRFN